MGGAPTRWAENSHKAAETAYGVESPVAVQIRTGPGYPPGYSSSMSIDRDDGAERQARLDWMINEFREAQLRRFVKRHEHVGESQLDANTKAPLTESATR